MKAIGRALLVIAVNRNYEQKTVTRKSVVLSLNESKRNINGFILFFDFRQSMTAVFGHILNDGVECSGFL